MKKISLVFILLFSLLYVYAQKTLTYDVKVINEKGANESEALVIFKNIKSMKPLEGKTDTTGTVSISLTQGQSYTVSVKKYDQEFDMKNVIAVPIGNYASVQLTLPITKPSKNSSFMSYYMSVTDFKGVPEANAQVICKNIKDNSIIEGTTDKDGKVTLELKRGEVYMNSVRQYDTLFIMDRQETVPLDTRYSAKNQSFMINILYTEIYPLNILFKSNDYSLSAQDKLNLKELVSNLNKYPTQKIELAAHTDNVGSDEANMTLSQNRAESVRKYLISQGISSDRLAAKGYGEKSPIASNETPDGRMKNRRTEVRIIKK